MTERDVNDAVYRELGLMVVRFSRLEWALGRWFDSLLQTWGDSAGIVSAKLSFVAMVDLIGALHRSRFPDGDLQALASLESRIRECEQRRNQFVHSLWGINIETGALVRAKMMVKAGKAVDAQYDRDPLTTLQNANQELSATVEEILRFARIDAPLVAP